MIKLDKTFPVVYIALISQFGKLAKNTNQQTDSFEI